MEATSYNHNIIGTEEKPLIPNLEFKLLHVALQHGDHEYYEEITEKYSFESHQKQIVEPLYKKLKQCQKKKS